MKELNKKANWAIGLSVVALIFVAIMFVLWCCNAGGFSAVSLDTFVGVIVALLAIIVTIAIGWQIWAAMDLKSNIAKLDSRIKEVEDIRAQFETQEQKNKQLYYEAQHFSHIAIAETHKNNKDYIGAFRFYMSALRCALKQSEPINLLQSVNKMKECAVSIKGQSIKIVKRSCESIIKNDKEIRQASMFRTIQDEYEETLELFKKKVNLNDNQE